MTSFYGGGVTIIEGGGGSSNYNDLVNTPIKNLNDGQILSELSDGMYNLTGNYKISNADQDFSSIGITLLTVNTSPTDNSKYISYYNPLTKKFEIIIIKKDGSYSISDMYSPVISGDNPYITIYEDGDTITESADSNTYITIYEEGDV